MATSVANSAANLAGKTLMTAEGAETVTGLKTFDRDPGAPFAVTASSTVVANLDADKVDGLHGTQFFRNDAVSSNSAQPRASAYNNAAQSLANNTFTALTFNTEDFDVGAMHSTGVNPSRMTIPAGGDGLYMIIGQVAYDANATGVRVAQVYKNGTTALAATQATPLAGNAAIVPITALANLVAGDYIELRGYQNSGGALNSGSATRDIGNILQIVKLW